MLTRQVLRDLARAEPGRLVVSVYARTDPRDPANTSSSPAWLIAARNALRAISERLEGSGDRDARLAFRALRKRVEDELVLLPPGGRARSVVWILDEGGSSTRFSLRLPLRRDRVVLDAKPFVSPLVDIADRGAPTGVILVGGELVRLVQIEQGEATEPENASFGLALGDWRPYGGTAGGSPARGLLKTSHEEHYRARVQAQRERMFETAAKEAARRMVELGWERIVLACERQIAARFRDALPAVVRERLISDADINLVGEETAAVADAVEPVIEESWSQRTAELIALAYERAQAGGAATIGAEETLAALAEGRVKRLILDPDLSYAAARVPPSIGGPPELLGERAVETAVSSSAAVSVVDASASPALRDAGGMVALLRY